MCDKHRKKDTFVCPLFITIFFYSQTTFCPYLDIFLINLFVLTFNISNVELGPKKSFYLI